MCKHLSNQNVAACCLVGWNRRTQDFKLKSCQIGLGSTCLLYAWCGRGPGNINGLFQCEGYYIQGERQGFPTLTWLLRGMVPESKKLMEKNKTSESSINKSYHHYKLSSMVFHTFTVDTTMTMFNWEESTFFKIRQNTRP